MVSPTGQTRLLDDHEASPRATHPPGYRRVHRGGRTVDSGNRPIGAFPNVITMDPPVLTKRRRVMSHAFTPKAIGKLEDGIRRRAAAMIDGLLESGGGDWIEDVADVLPMSVIGDIVGIPDEDRPRIFDTLDRILKTSATRRPSDEEHSWRCSGTSSPMPSNSRPISDETRPTTSGARSTTAVVTDESGEELSIPANELEIFFFVLTLAGSDTTKNALAAGLQAFVANPAEIHVFAPTIDSRQVDRRGVALVDASRVLDAFDESRRRDGRHHHPQGRSGGVDAAFGQPRRGGLRRPVHVRHRPRGQSRTSPSAEADPTTA